MIGRSHPPCGSRRVACAAIVRPPRPPASRSLRSLPLAPTGLRFRSAVTRALPGFRQPPRSPQKEESNMQRLTCTGRLTRDPELRELPNGGSVCKLRLAVDDMARGRETGYINVSTFGKPGEAAAEILSHRLAGRGRRPPRVPRVGAGRQDPPRLRGDRQRRVPRRPAPGRRSLGVRAARRGSRLTANGRDATTPGVPPTSLPRPCTPCTATRPTRPPAATACSSQTRSRAGWSDGDGRHYESPPQSEQQARSLVAVLVGAEIGDHCGPWRQAIAGGQRIIELRAER